MTNLSQTARLLKLFKKQKILTNRQIVTMVGTYRYSARIAELRAEGHIIIAERVKDGLWRYIYKGQSDELVLDKYLDKVNNNPKKHEKTLLDKIKQWL